MIDQSLLPVQIVYLTLTHEQQVAAITTLKRGAQPLASPKFGMALALYCLLRERGRRAPTVVEVQAHLRAVGEMFHRTRPTAVNLQWATERMLRRANHAISEQCSFSHLAQILGMGEQLQMRTFRL
jgi:methylthioribose-1-phosphate isomerase